MAETKALLLVTHSYDRGSMTSTLPRVSVLQEKITSYIDIVYEGVYEYLVIECSKCLKYETLSYNNLKIIK